MRVCLLNVGQGKRTPERSVVHRRLLLKYSSHWWHFLKNTAADDIFQLSTSHRYNKADMSSKLSLHRYYSVKNTSAAADIFMMWLSCKIWRGGILGNQAFGSDGNTQVHRIRRRKYTDVCFGQNWLLTDYETSKLQMTIRSTEGVCERIYSYFQDAQKQWKVYRNFFLLGEGCMWGVPLPLPVKTNSLIKNVWFREVPPPRALELKGWRTISFFTLFFVPLDRICHTRMLN